MTTAQEIGANLSEALQTYGKASAAVNAVSALKGKVEHLRRESVSGETVEDCEKAARDLIKASEDLRLAEIVLPAKQRASTEAFEAATEAARKVIGKLSHHFEGLATECYAVALQIARKLVAPEVAAVSEFEPDGMNRERLVHGMAGIAPGNVAAIARYRRAEAIRSNRTLAVISEAQAMLETYDADTLGIRADISKLQQILSVLDGGESERQGTVSAPAAQAAEAA